MLQQTKQNLIFIDESHFYSETFWKDCGWFCHSACPMAYDQGVYNAKSVSLLLAIGYNGRAHHLLHKHEHSKGVKQDIFMQFLYDLHQKEPIEKIFILDNAQVHTARSVMNLMEAMFMEGRSIVFQAKYSPELNPIEYVFGILKRRAKDTTQIPAELFAAVNQLCLNIDPDMCKNTINKVFDL